MSHKPAPATDQILDLLLDALAERQSRREAPPAGAPLPAQPTPAPSAPSPISPPPEVASPISTPLPAPAVEAAPATRAAVAGPAGQDPRSGTRPVAEPPNAPPVPPHQLGRTLSRLWVLLAALLIVINIPLGRGGLNLAHLVPSTASLIIRDGLVLKGPGPEIYVMQDNRLRWITSLQAFDYFGYRWSQVHSVDAGFLAQFAQGAPLSVLLKCETSPHIYALENDRKRWIKDIPTFEAQGFVWTDVKIVDCADLRALPDGTPIPPDAGPPPQP